MADKLKSNVVVTGVSSGIGASIAAYMMDQGYTVYGSVRKIADAESLSQSHPDQFHPMVFDVRDRNSVQLAAQGVESTLNGGDNRLAALVNNAGLASFGPMEKLDDQQFEDTVGINLFGTRNVTNAFLPLLRPSSDDIGTLRQKRKCAGVIINISSLSGILNTPMNGAYCVSKHAVESLGEIYRRELYASGVDVCSIRSGPIQSKIWEKNIDVRTTYDDPDYNLMSTNAVRIMRAAEKNALPASVIAKLVLDIVERRKCKTAYALGDGSISARVLSTLLPVRLADRLIGRALLKPRA